MSIQVATSTPERGIHDPLDLQLQRLTLPTGDVNAVPEPAGPRDRAWSIGTHAVVLLLVGVAAGRQGLGILSDTTLALLDPVIPVALAAIGVRAAFEIGTTPWLGGRALAAATAQGLIAGVVVAAGTLGFAQLLSDATAGSLVVLAIMLGVCASTSSSLSTSHATTRSRVTHVADLDAFVPIVVGGLAIVAMRERELLPAFAMTLQVTGIAVTVAVVGWLLLTPTALDTEQRVFGAATLLILGGVADYLSVSALMAGLVAGAFWHVAGGATRESMRRDLAHLQRPLTALILLVAGARTEFTPAIIGLAIGYVVLRGVGKLAGSLAATVVDPALGRGVAARLLAPGILGVAFALNAARTAGADTTVLLSVAVLGTIGSQLLAGAPPPEDGE